MALKKVIYVLNFTSFICCSLSLLLLILSPVQYRFMVTEIDSNTYITYHTPISHLSENDLILTKQGNDYVCTTYLSKDAGNRRLHTDSTIIPYVSYIGKVVFTIPFLISYHTLSQLGCMLLLVYGLHCFTSLHHLKMLPDIANIKLPHIRTKVQSH